MPKTKEMVVFPDGKIGTMYDDEVPEMAKDLSASLTIRRASNVEWDPVLSGWTVLSTGNPRLGIRYNKKDTSLGWSVKKVGQLVAFRTRNEAVEEERKLFWNLLEK